MKNNSSIAIVIMTGLLLSGYHGIAQTAEELFPKAIQLEEVKGDLESAINIYKSILKQYPENNKMCAKATLHMGLCYEKLGSEQARQAYRDVINKYADQEAEVDMARERISNLDAHLADLNLVAEQHFRQGNEYFKQWEYEDAVKEYEDAIKLRPNTLLAMNAQYCIGQSWYRAGKYDEAFTTLTNLIEENPNSTIAPVTELMLAQVQHSMAKTDNPVKLDSNSDQNTFLDPETGITYRKTKTYTGKNDWINYATGGFNMSPDGRFLVLENKVVPVDGQEPFYLLDMDVLRAKYSPDMKKATFLADSAIWVVDVSPETGKTVGKPVDLLHGNYRYQVPLSWSPDSKYLIFGRSDDSIEADIWKLCVSDGKMEPVITSPQYEGRPIWSPDGNSIAYRKDAQLYLYSFPTDSEKMVDPNTGADCWSPDSKWLIDSNWKTGHLYSIDNEISYTFNYPEQVGRLISFSPDGEKLMFYRPSSDDKWGMKVVSSSGGPSFNAALGCSVYGSRWSADGNFILAQSEDDKGDVAFKVISLSGQDPISVDIENNTENPPFPFDASPDLKKIAYTVDREDGNADIYVIPFSLDEGKTTGKARRVFEGWSGGAFNVAISWSPDGKNLAIIHDGDIWICPTEGGDLRRLTDTPENYRWVEWAPDGTMLSFMKFSGKTGVLCTIPSEGGSPIEIYEDCQGSHWSPDSKSLALISGNELKIISADGSTVKYTLNKKEMGLDFFYSTPRYSPDGKFLAFIGYYNDEKNLIVKYSLEDHKITCLADDNLEELKYAINWSPDGNWISYLTEEDVKVRPEGSLWEADFSEVIEKLAANK